jgi:lipoprotein-releasing system ATP-binding protein
MGAGQAASSDVSLSLRRLHAERGITFLVVTHDAHLAERCDRRLELVDVEEVHTSAISR